ncbi:dienelactone hydrolase family protein [Thermaurantiacus sp.]
MDRLPEDVNWARMSGVSRRAALGGGAAVLGYALAAQPVASTAIRTPADGLEAGRVQFPAGGGFRMNAYRARPSGGKPRPVILVIQEIFGLHAWIEDVVRRFAHAGFYAIAPDLFQRFGDPTRIADIKTLRETIISKVSDADVIADLDALVAFAATDGGNTRRLGITGFCWGGRITWLYAAHNPGLKAGVAWYGRLTGEVTAMTPRHPIDVAGQLKAPVLGLYGSEDRGIPVADVEAMNAALRAARKPSEIRLFAADHGFLADYRPSFSPTAAPAAWSQALSWFRKL